MTTATKPNFSEAQLQEIRKIVHEELEKHFEELNKELEAHAEAEAKAQKTAPVVAWTPTEWSTDTGIWEDLTSLKGIKKYLQNLFLSELKKNIK